MTNNILMPEQFSLKWNNFFTNLSSGFLNHLTENDLVDVTLAVEGQLLQAHKLVLSVCSPYFKSIFKENPCQHPVVILKDVKYNEIESLLKFMYQGEINIKKEDLSAFLKVAQTLQIKGLATEKTSNLQAVSNQNATQLSINSNTQNVAQPQFSMAYKVNKNTDTVEKRKRPHEIKKNIKKCKQDAQPEGVDDLPNEETDDKDSLVITNKDTPELLKGENDTEIILETQEEEDDQKLNITNEIDGQSTSENATQQGFMHFISKIEKRPDRKEVRKRCSGCYEGLRESGFHWEEASKKARKVNTECKMCNKVFCMKCFEKYHSLK
ncbi:uncharacterized protein LOC143185813 isoform X2 [Calliopsis andreniformis]|uniref:uncharacterized protein LOC143185813 isoform X2 n=1 Tax=Calliopsis andreniformis TaxID=337506 RepID=UPI003FCDBA17